MATAQQRMALGGYGEAQAALQRFRAAAEREAATVELARRLVRYLYLARQDPRLRFEG